MTNTPINRESMERLAEMIAIACDILQNEAADAIREYDDAECDGGCVADDLESAFETLLATLAQITEQRSCDALRAKGGKTDG